MKTVTGGRYNMEDTILQAIVARIKAGLMTIEQVPEPYKTQVQEMVGSFE